MNELKKKSRQTKKMKIEDFLKNNPQIKVELNKMSMKYIGDVHQFMANNSDVQAVVHVSFEFIR